MGAHTHTHTQVASTHHESGKVMVVCVLSVSSFAFVSSCLRRPKHTARCRPSSFLERPRNWPLLFWTRHPLISLFFCRQFLAALWQVSLSTFTSLGSALPDPLGLAALWPPAAGWQRVASVRAAGGNGVSSLASTVLQQFAAGPVCRRLILWPILARARTTCTLAHSPTRSFGRILTACFVSPVSEQKCRSLVEWVSLSRPFSVHCLLAAVCHCLSSLAIAAIGDLLLEHMHSACARVATGLALSSN